MARIRALVPLSWLVPVALAATILTINTPDAHGAAGRPRMTGARLLTPGADGSAGLLRVAFNTPICFAGTRRGDRVLAVRGYRVDSIARVRKALHLVARIRSGHPRFAVARDRV